MAKFFIIFNLLLFCLCPVLINAAEDQLTNIRQPAQQRGDMLYAPGQVILLPDGKNAIIEEILPDGDLKTDLGIVISPEGVIRDGANQGQRVSLDPRFSVQQEVNLSVPTPATAPTPAVTPAPEKRAIPEVVEKPVITPAPENNPPAIAQKKEPEKVVITPVVPEQKKQPQSKPEQKREDVTLAQLLPLTVIKPETKKAEEAPKQEPKQPEKQVKEKQKEAKKEEKKEEPKTPKVKNGEELRIPPEAAKTGNLDFLEGCWQGTRPEYFSKRTIRECFCFGANGKNGKRRIYDGNRRMCIGATKAHLSKEGVLSVTSSGAACNDGERWGAAEMVCRNSGPKTPCSWIFTDANNGRQAYTIPFVRVPACGR